ncbi:MAG: hypothetical protein HKN25_10405 [Pyrinomonadaceae bacterium]|nr:hypothetical protein [Pyrinomonadaceae bacterium]
MDRYFFSAYYDGERLTGIDRIKEEIGGFGFIIDFKMFSDVSMSVSIEIEERKISRLFFALSSIMKIDDFESLNSSSNKECLVLLNVTFNKGTGDKRIKAPAVPG